MIVTPSTTFSDTESAFYALSPSQSRARGELRWAYSGRALLQTRACPSVLLRSFDYEVEYLAATTPNKSAARLRCLALLTLADLFRLSSSAKQKVQAYISNNIYYSTPKLYYRKASSSIHSMFNHTILLRRNRHAASGWQIGALSLLLTIASVPPAPAFAQVAQPTAAPVTKTQGGYIKALRGKDGSLDAAQTAIRRFNPIHGNGPSVYLVAAVHIGEKSYYKQLQQFLDKQSVVLYEGVRPSHIAAQTRSVRAAGPHASKPPVGIQKKLSDALNLEFQLDGIHYNRSQFRNSDLDWDTMTALATKAGPDTQRSLAELGNSVSGGPSITQSAQILDKVLTLSASTPFLATILRRLLVTVVSDPDKMRDMVARSQEQSGTLDSAKKLDSILIKERNKAVLADLKALLQTSKRHSPKPIQSIALFYGAEHMKDIEQHLVSDLGYRTADAQWITAIQAAH